MSCVGAHIVCTQGARPHARASASVPVCACASVPVCASASVPVCAVRVPHVRVCIRARVRVCIRARVPRARATRAQPEREFLRIPPTSARACSKTGMSFGRLEPASATKTHPGFVGPTKLAGVSVAQRGWLERYARRVVHAADGTLCPGKGHGSVSFRRIHGLHFAKRPLRGDNGENAGAAPHATSQR